MARKRSDRDGEDARPPEREAEPAAPPPDGPSLFGDALHAATAAPYVVLARKYRPRTFDDLIGQEAMVTTLRNAFAADRIAQAYMLTGVRGVGKTTTARILARGLNFSRDAVPGFDKVDRPTVDLPLDPAGWGRHCKEILESRHPDVIEIDAASNTGVENIRELIESARYRPSSARIKVYIIDEVHMLSKGAFNALLKTLEEPPEHVKFIFATTEVRKVPVTVLSRCQRFDLRRVEVGVLVAHFQRIAAAEGATAEPEALALIARAAEGSVRDGLSILDQAIASRDTRASGATGSGAVTLEGVRAMLGLADRGRIFDLVGLLLSGRTADALAAFDALHKDGADPIQVLEDLAETLHTITRAKVAGEAGAGEALSGEERRRAVALAGTLSLPLLSRAWQMLLKGLDEAARAPDPRAAAEMVLIRIAHVADVPAPDEIIRLLGGSPSQRASSASVAQSGTAAAASSPPPLRGRDREGAPATPALTRETAAGSPASPALPRKGGGSPAADDEPPPVASLDDYGAGPEEQPPVDDEFVGDPDDAPAAVPQLADPRTFEEVVALVGERRDVRLRVHLEDHASLVKFDAAAGSIDLFLLPGAPPEMANDLREKLSKWTGRRWMVVLSKARGAKPLGEVRREQEAAALEQVKQHPAVRAVLDAFPGARLAARPLKVAKDDEA